MDESLLQTSRMERASDAVHTDAVVNKFSRSSTPKAWELGGIDLRFHAIG